MASVEVGRQQSAAGAFPIGQRITLPGHFREPVVLEAVRPIGAGYECRVRLPDGSPDEAILSADEAELLFGQTTTAGTKVAPAEADKLRLSIESARIRLAYTHDRHFAVSLSGIRTLRQVPALPAVAFRNRHYPSHQAAPQLRPNPPRLAEQRRHPFASSQGHRRLTLT